MVDVRRWPRVRQLGATCSTEGCSNDCVGNDLCSKCNMRERRKQDKYKAYTREYNKKYKRPDINKVCRECGCLYKSARLNQRKCSSCSGGKAVK